jgi:hypothetical protein
MRAADNKMPSHRYTLLPTAAMCSGATPASPAGSRSRVVMSAAGGDAGRYAASGARAFLLDLPSAWRLLIVVLGDGTSRLALERPPTGFSDPDANDPDRLAASFDGLPLCCCKPGVDEAGEQITGEAVGEQQRLGEAALVDGEQFQRLARFQAETAFSKGRRHRESSRCRPSRQSNAGPISAFRIPRFDVKHGCGRCGCRSLRVSHLGIRDERHAEHY